jgi:outer membrane protein assembly factor BamD
MRNGYRTGVAAVLVAVLAGCGARSPQVRTTPEDLFRQGMEQFERRRWSESIETFERLVLEFPGTPRIQEARFHIGEAYYHRREYVSAAAEFMRLVSDYPTGPFASRARARGCDAYFALSPRPELDQSYTTAAIEHCSSVAQLYPGTEEGERARQRISELEEKLAQKAYASGEFYLRRRAPDSAIIYYEDVVRAYPATSYAPRALLRLVEVFRSLGYVEEAEAARERLMREYPGTAEARQAQGMSLATGT